MSDIRAVMLMRFSTILMIALTVPACKVDTPDKTTAADSGTDTTGSETLATTGSDTTDALTDSSDTAATAGSEGWPPVACGDTTCMLGEICYQKEETCEILDDPCPGETTGGETGECGMDVLPPPYCMPVPSACQDAADLKTCLVGALCIYSFAPEDSTLAAGYLACAPPAHGCHAPPCNC